MDTHIDFDILFGTVDSYATLTTLIDDDSVRLTLPVRDPDTQSRTGVTIRGTREQGKAGGHGSMKGSRSLVPDTIAGMTSATSVKSMSRTVRVDIDKLNDLMSTVGELVLVNATISELTDRLRHEGAFRASIDLGKAATLLNRRLQDLQRGVMNIRMVPIAQLYEKLSLVSRNISRDQGKTVELRLYGADTELDKMIADDISDPLMHIIRNSVDHGIEPPQKRRLAGKDEKGVIRITSCQRGNHVVMEVEDDGAGIDLEKIRDRAVERGIVTDRSQLTDRDAIELIFVPGFSTSDSITGVSGRGVGMDVVRNNIGAVSGRIDVESRFGKGTRFIITLPITLAIIRTLIIRTAGRTYAVPVTSVKESLIITGRDIMTVERREVVHLRDLTLPLLRLDDFFGCTVSKVTTDELYVVVVGAADKCLGIVVDGLAGQQDIVIKPLGTAFRHLRGISGAAELGDRSTILVLDINGIVNEVYNAGS